MRQGLLRGRCPYSTSGVSPYQPYIRNQGSGTSRDDTYKPFELRLHQMYQMRYWVMHIDCARCSAISLAMASNSLHKKRLWSRAQPRAQPNGRQTLHLSVQDTGIGMDPSQQEMIFGEFTQVDTSTTRQYGGTVLGLAICRQLVEMMRGQIWLESQYRSSSTFHFTTQFERQSVSLSTIPTTTLDTSQIPDTHLGQCCHRRRFY